MGTQGIHPGKQAAALAAFCSKTRKDALGRGWSTVLPHHCQQHQGQEPSRAKPESEQCGWGGEKGRWVGPFILHGPGKARGEAQQ